MNFVVGCLVKVQRRTFPLGVWEMHDVTSSREKAKVGSIKHNEVGLVLELGQEGPYGRMVRILAPCGIGWCDSHWLEVVP